MEGEASSTNDMFATAQIERVTSPTVVFSFSQMGRRLLSIENFVFQLNKKYTPKNGGNTVLYWHCERRRDIGCIVSVTTDTDGVIIRGSTSAHTHAPSNNRVSALAVRHDLLAECTRRPEAAPASLLNEFVTPSIALALPSEAALKQAIQRRRRGVRPKDPDTAADVLISGEWAQTLEGKEWFLGEVSVISDKGYVFATEDNLRRLNVSSCFYSLLNN